MILSRSHANSSLAQNLQIAEVCRRERRGSTSLLLSQRQLACTSNVEDDMGNKSSQQPDKSRQRTSIGRRELLLSGTAIVAAAALGANDLTTAQAQTAPAPSSSGAKPNILVIFGDDI